MADIKKIILHAVFQVKRLTLAEGIEGKQGEKPMKTTGIFVLCVLLAALSATLPAFARSSGTTELVSVSSDSVLGNENSWAPATSTDGRFVAFVSDADNLVTGDANGKVDIFVRDR
jgi:hypothetical protein